MGISRFLFSSVVDALSLCHILPCKKLQKQGKQTLIFYKEKESICFAPDY